MKRKLKTLILSLIPALFLISCANVDSCGQRMNSFSKYVKLQSSSKKESSIFQELTVRLTGYWKKGKGTDKWTRKGKTSTGIPTSHMITAAVDPKIIPYHSRILIKETNPPLHLIALDTGTDVIKRKASRLANNGEPVVDIFFEKESDARRFLQNNPQIVNAKIQPL